MNVSNLNNNEITVLKTMTLLYEISMTENEWKKVADRIMVESLFEKTFHHLYKQGFFVIDSGFYGTAKRFRVHPSIYFCLLREIKDDLFFPLYDSLYSYYHDKVKYKDAIKHTEILYGLFSERISIKNKDYIAGILKDLVEEVSYVFGNPDYETFVRNIPTSFLSTQLDNILYNMLLKDMDVDWEYLRAVMLGEERKLLIHSTTVFAFYYYLGTGKMCIDSEKQPITSYALLIYAIASLYQSDYANAYKLFVKVISTRKKELTYNNAVYGNCIINFYYTLSLLLLKEEKGKNKLEKLVALECMRSSEENQILIAPLYYFFCKKQNVNLMNGVVLKVFDANNENNAIKHLACAIIKQLNIKNELIALFEQTAGTTHAAFLNTETQCCKTNDEDGVKMRRLAKSSLLERLDVKPFWVTKLEDLLAYTQEQKQETKKGSSDTQLVYLIMFERIIPILKKRLKNGTWSVGRELTIRTFKNLHDNCMDETDIAFSNSVELWEYDIYLRKYIYLLENCNRVFCGSSYDMHPVSIHSDRPFLIINKNKDNSFGVSSNIADEIQNNAIGKCFVKNSETDYSIFNITPYEQKVYQTILSQKTYPAEAEQMLIRLIQSIGGKTQVHSNMVEGLEQIKKVEGKAVIALRVAPMEEEYFRLSFVVHPIEHFDFVPGQGSVSTITEVKGEKCIVVRKLKKEKSNLKTIEDKLAELEIMDEAQTLELSSITDSITISIVQLLPLIEWVQQNNETCEMEWLENCRIKYRGKLNCSNFNIALKSKNNWFEVVGDVCIDNEKMMSLYQLLQQMHLSDKSKYVKIGDNEYIKLSNDLKRILQQIDTATTENRSHLLMVPAAVGLMDEVVNHSDIHVKRNAAVDALIQKMKDAEKLHPQVPKTLNAQLRNYQEVGFEWMSKLTAWGAGACLADDMGLGKTLQTITLLLEQAQSGPSLIVVPASLVPNWRKELSRFAPTLNVFVLNDEVNREQAIEQISRNEVLVTTYALLTIHQQQLSQKSWNVVVLDEAHTIKNPNTKMSKAAMTLKAERKVILTGTPIQNHLSELWNLFQFINPGLLGNAEQFKKKYIIPIEENKNKERQGQLKKLISPFLLRRTKGEVIEELPEKNDINLPVELSDNELAMYELHRKKAEELAMAEEGVKLSTLSEITKLRQMACSISLVDKTWKKASSKLSTFIALAESLNDSGGRALVFSQFTSFLAEVRQVMDKIKLPYLYLDGATPIRKREEIVDEFQKGNYPFFLISLKAGGLGLNLTAANYVVHLDPWWNPAIEQQATDRAYRIGQRNDVTVYHLIAQHTIEEKIIRLHKTKRDLADSLLEGGDMVRALTQEEILDLLKEV